MLRRLVISVFLGLALAGQCLGGESGGSKESGISAATNGVSPRAVNPAAIHVVREGKGERVWFAGAEGPIYEEIVDTELAPGGQRLAYIARKGGRLVVVADGQEGAPYEEIGDLRFSPDGKRLGYRASKGRRGWVVVVDGLEGREYSYIAEESPLFSPEGRSVAYVGQRPGRLGWKPWVGVNQRVPSVVVLNGQEGPHFDHVYSQSLIFSPDGSRLAYVGVLHGKSMVVVDGKPGTGYDAINGVPAVYPSPPPAPSDTWTPAIFSPGWLAFSPDSKRIAYWASRGKPLERYLAPIVVVDDQEQSVLGTPAEPPVFSPDSKRVAYVIRTIGILGSRCALLVDGREVASAGRIARVTFRPDSQGLSYLISTWGKWYRVADGQRTALEDEELPRPLKSPSQGDPLHWLPSHLQSYVLAHGRLPATETPAALEEALEAPVRVRTGLLRSYTYKMPDLGSWYFTDPETGELFGTNRAVSGRKLSDLKDPGRTIIVYQTRPGPDGLRRVLFADGSVRSLTETRWAVLSTRSGIPQQ